jgi:hypothetical protein
VDDPTYVLLDHDVEEARAAEAFLAVLRRNVWGSAQASPYWFGAPQIRIVDAVEDQAI